MAEKHDALLKEYEACQSHTNALGNQMWFSNSIVFSANVVLLAGLGYAVIQEGNTLHPIFAIVSLVLFIVISVFLYLLRRWTNRVRFLMGVNHVRMRKVEDEILDQSKSLIEKNWLVYGLDLKHEYDRGKNNSWCKLSEQRKKLIEDISTRYPFFPKYYPPTDRYFNWVFSLIIILPWILFTIVTFVLSSENW